MDAIGFQTWLSDFGRKFPAVREWLRVMARGDQDALLDSWELALGDVGLDDCLEANQRMVSGELEPPGEWPAQWQGIPARLRRHAVFLAANRWTDSPRKQSDEKETLRNLLVRAREKAGVPRAEINRELLAAGFEAIAVPSAAEEPCHSHE